jgi:tetratricopeptide (TPR) repeat protein
LKAAGDLTPDNDIVQRNLGALYNEEGRYAEAIDVLQRSLRLKKSAGVYAALGSALFYLHRFPEAMAAAENAVALMPRYYHWGNLGIYAKWTPGAEQKSTAALRQAIEGAEKALVITPNNYDVLADLAEYRARLGDPRGALAAIQRIPRPPEPSLAVRLAIAHELAGRRAEAIEEILSAVKSPASFNQVRNDPDLQQLWSDATLQRELEKRRSSR